MHLELMEMSPSDFELLSRVVYRLSGIVIKPGKEVLVRARLSTRVKRLGFTSFREYLNYLQSANGPEEFGALVDIMTTNKTAFFRDPTHFELLRTRILPELSEQKRVRLWSAACSTGEEPYSMAMVAESVLPNTHQRNVKVLATDISDRVLSRAALGRYDIHACLEIPGFLRQRFMQEVPGAHQLVVRPTIRRMVQFAPLNLTGEWPMKGQFDVIFCRNVMIYFDLEVRQQLAQRFWDILNPNGYLFLGCAESLTGLVHSFRALQPAVYQKRPGMQ